MGTKIEWTDQTWNPIVGCSKASPGCQNCYAERMAVRLAGMDAEGYVNVIENKKWNGITAFIPRVLYKPRNRKKPTRYFVGSMTDLFHGATYTDWLDQIWDVTAACPQHTFQILTKRPKYMQEYVQDKKTLPNVWLGVTAENQEQADKRIPFLMQTPAALRFVSVEPMLERMDISRYLGRNLIPSEHGMSNYPMDGIDWVICGAETGPGARPMDPKWALNLKAQCIHARVPFFFKKWGKGSHLPSSQWRMFPEVPDDHKL